MNAYYLSLVLAYYYLVALSSLEGFRTIQLFTIRYIYLFLSSFFLNLNKYFNKYLNIILINI